MMGQVSLPELRRYKYSGSFATGTLAAGGTLGILIPPSIPLIIYAIIVEGIIVQLFQTAAVLTTVGYLTVIFERTSGERGARQLRAAHDHAIENKMNLLFAEWANDILLKLYSEIDLRRRQTVAD